MLVLVTIPFTPDGTGVDPLVLMPSEASVENPLALIRLVMVTGRNTLKLAFTATPGVPVHWKSMSPSCSARPSECTSTGTLVTVQVVGVWANTLTEEIKINTRKRYNGI